MTRPLGSSFAFVYLQFVYLHSGGSSSRAAMKG